MIFVFGSNMLGRHGAGAALEAHNKWGAVYGIPCGRTGNAYAIPTKDYNMETMPLFIIRVDVAVFLEYARNNPEEWFLVTRIGCGLAGYKNEDIAPMFRDAPNNCYFSKEWAEFLVETLDK